MKRGFSNKQIHGVANSIQDLLPTHVNVTTITTNSIIVSSGSIGLDNASIANVVATNVSSGTLNTTNLVATSITTGNLRNLRSTNASVSNLVVSNLTTGSLRLNDNTLFLRPGNDTNHFIRYAGVSNTFANTAPNGPVLCGFEGGILGTTGGGERAVLQWFNNGNVAISAGSLNVGGSVATASLTTTNASVSNLVANNMSATNNTTSNLAATNASINNLVASSVSSGSVVSNNITAGNFFSTNNTISNLLNTNITTSNIRTTNINATNATMSSVRSTTINAFSVVSEDLFSTNFDTFNINATTGSMTNVSSSNIRTGFLTTGSMLSSNNTISNALITSATVSNGVLSNASIGNALITNTNSSNNTISNALITNSTVSNGVLSNASIGNSVITNINATNNTTSNARITNATVSNLNSTNINTTNNTISNALITNINGANASFSNLIVSGSASISPVFTSLTTGTIVGSNANQQVNITNWLRVGNSTTATNNRLYFGGTAGAYLCSSGGNIQVERNGTNFGLHCDTDIGIAGNRRLYVGASRDSNFGYWSEDFGWTFFAPASRQQPLKIRENLVVGYELGGTTWASGGNIFVRDTVGIGATQAAAGYSLALGRNGIFIGRTDGSVLNPVCAIDVQGSDSFIRFAPTTGSMATETRTIYGQNQGSSGLLFIKGSGSTIGNRTVTLMDSIIVSSQVSNSTRASVYFENVTGPFISSNTNGNITINGGLVPLADNNSSLGISSRRWTGVWATNNVIQTSDGRHKKDVQPEYGLDFVRRLKPIQYKWDSDRDGNICHTYENVIKHGFLAQDIEQLVEQNDGIVYRGQSDDDVKGLIYTEFVSILTQAIQDLDGKFHRPWYLRVKHYTDKKIIPCVEKNVDKTVRKMEKTILFINRKR